MSIIFILSFLTIVLKKQLHFGGSGGETPPLQVVWYHSNCNMQTVRYNRLGKILQLRKHQHFPAIIVGATFGRPFMGNNYL